MNNARDRAFSALSPFLFARTRLRTAPARWHSRPSTSRLKSLGNAFAARVALLPKWPPAELQLSNTITQGDGNRVQANSPSASSLSCPAAQIPYHTQKHECPMAIHAIQQSRHSFLSVRRGAKGRRTQMHLTIAELALHDGGLGVVSPTSEVQKVKRLPCLLQCSQMRSVTANRGFLLPASSTTMEKLAKHLSAWLTTFICVSLYIRIEADIIFLSKECLELHCRPIRIVCFKNDTVVSIKEIGYQ